METLLNNSQLVSSRSMTECHHCGEMREETIQSKGVSFCCQGCVTVYEILCENGLEHYYQLEKSPGIAPNKYFEGQFSFLADQQTASKLFTFENKGTALIELNVPGIHCMSCVWLLENLSRLNTAVTSSEVNFARKSIKILFNKDLASLEEIVELITDIGYEPNLNFSDLNKESESRKHHLVARIAVAAFCFGNIMLFSFPHYFGLTIQNNEEAARFFGIMNFLLSIPVFFYCGSDYFKAALNSFKR